MVIDASVLLKFFLYEDDSPKVYALIDQHRRGLKDINVPALFLYEMTNVLSLKNRFSLREIAEALAVIFSLSLEVAPLISNDFYLAAELSRKYNISAYDASYLALSMKHDCLLITADKKFYHNVSFLENVVLLSDYYIQEEL